MVGAYHECIGNRKMISSLNHPKTRLADSPSEKSYQNSPGSYIITRFSHSLLTADDGYSIFELELHSISCFGLVPLGGGWLVTAY